MNISKTNSHKKRSHKITLHQEQISRALGRFRKGNTVELQSFELPIIRSDCLKTEEVSQATQIVRNVQQILLFIFLQQVMSSINVTNFKLSVYFTRIRVYFYFFINLHIFLIIQIYGLFPPNSDNQFYCI